ncbi:hypothetical protein M3F59_13360 [Brachybacterium muris]|uniref:hypothetical protein n=1 Tax=Brachybacterium muris TaxID=219301 RepID=UPI00223B3887|nr:hypothetical protein [Brachybacterium muris]MCT2262591.1 hypothetical protein [Brachybacterium muris]
MSIVLVGGGPDTTRSPAVVAPFLETCRSTSVAHVAVLLTGSAHIAARFAWDYLELLAPLDTDVRVVPLDGGPVAEEICTAGALLVGGGPTPVYREAQGLAGEREVVEVPLGARRIHRVLPRHQVTGAHGA